MKSNLAAAAALLLAVAFGYFYFQTSSNRARAEADLAASRTELDRLQSDIDSLKKQQLPDSELNRLKSDQAEAEKLRKEVDGLKQSLAATQSNIDSLKQTSSGAASQASQQKANSQNAESESTPQLRIFSSKVNAHIPASHALAVGGWQSAPGKRAFALLTPSAVATVAGAPPQIQVAAKWIEASTDAAARLQLDTFLSGAGDKSSLLPPDYLDQFLKSVETTEGAKIISSPRVLTFAGQEATVSVTSTLQTANGPIHIGPEIRVTPNVAADGSIDLAVNATLTVNAKDSQSN